MRSILAVITSMACMAFGDASFRVIYTQDVVTRPPADFVRYYAVNIWFRYQNYNGFAKISRIWPGTVNPLAEAAAYCETLMCQEF